jgi:predicted aspartyl protease
VTSRTAFDPERNIIVVPGEVSGRLGTLPLRLVVDTGSSETLLLPDVLEKLGYSVRDAEQVTSVYSAVGKEHGYITRVTRFAALGFEVEDFRVHVYDLPDRYQIDGLLGLSYLRRLNYEIRSAEGVILASLITS